MQPVISINQLSKVYADGNRALNKVSLDIQEGEILALLGPNGAGKTTLISIICGLSNATSGSVKVMSLDNRKDYRKVREMIGLVPQELALGIFERVWNTVNYSRGLHGKKKDADYISQLLKDLSLYDKKNNLIMELSGGMKRRVLIAKALSHQPKILFLDEPTAGVDVELRKDMWQIIRKLRASGVTIILTTHYIEEAEEIADRVGVIKGGELVILDEKDALMSTLGKQQISLELTERLDAIPTVLADFNVELSDDGLWLKMHYNAQQEQQRVAEFMESVTALKLPYKDIHSYRTSLEDIFVDLVKK